MQKGSLKVVKNRRGAKVWRAQWREHGAGRTRILGRYCDMDRTRAEAELEAILAPLRSAEAATKRGRAITLGEFIDRGYLVVRNAVWKDSTRSTTEQLIRTHIVAGLGSRAVTSITRAELQSHLTGKAAAGFSKSVVLHIRWQLAAIFTLAMGDGLVSVNPTDGLVNPRIRRRVDQRVISVDDLTRAQLVLDIRERLIFRLAVCEGMRPGEIVGLRIADIRDDGIHIERRVYRGNVDDPKTAMSRRVVPPTAVTGKLLSAFMEILTGKPDAWLFESERGTPLSYSGVWRRRIRPELAKIGIVEVNFQILRRTWVTVFSDVEKDPKIRAQLAGHSVDVHQNVYQQADHEALKRAVRKMDDRLQ